jgi:drug/metabolite transporter (DMT)-like permease
MSSVLPAPLAPPRHAALPVLALTYNAFAWGLSWWPFRYLHGQGLHPLWATCASYALAVLLILLWRPQAWGPVWRTPALWVVVLASGTTNASFNWAVTVGDVVRVVLLFYLMPLWSVALARWLLHERLSARDLLRVGLALAGAAVVLWPAEGGWPLPRALHEWLGLLGGMAFALNNVMLRREAARPQESRALAMFAGSVAAAGALGAGLAFAGQMPGPALPGAGGTVPVLALVLGLGLVFLSSNLALQYGAARLPVTVTAVVMLTEVVFAAASSVWIGGEALTGATLAGGALILSAALLSTLAPPSGPAPGAK